MNVTLRGRRHSVRTVSFDAAKNQVRLIEQRLLPHEFKVIGTRDYRATAAAIRDMVVRGAGAIGATAAYGLAQGARAFRGRDLAKFQAHVETVFQTLKAARPTAVDPVNAMLAVRAHMSAGPTVAAQQALALATPSYLHLPVVTEPDGQKLSKSRRSIAVETSAATIATSLRGVLKLLRQDGPPETARTPREILEFAAAEWNTGRFRGLYSVSAD